MSAPEDLHDIYSDELKDLWSANDQMQRCLKKFVTKAANPSLKELLTTSQEGIAQHTAMLKELIVANDGKVTKEHCKGMEGLVSEATKHTGEEAPKKGPLLDTVIVAQCQRMTHYGLAGFGTAAAYAKVLGRDDDHKKLSSAVKDMHGGDAFMSKLSESALAVQARDA